MENNTLENGIMESNMEEEYMSFQMAKEEKVNGEMVKELDG